MDFGAIGITEGENLKQLVDRVHRYHEMCKFSMVPLGQSFYPLPPTNLRSPVYPRAILRYLLKRVPSQALRSVIYYLYMGE